MTDIHPPYEALSVSDMLNALGMNCGIAEEKPVPYLAIPGHDGPRWLIPAQSRAAASVLSIWHPYNISSRMKWYAVCLAAQAGVLRWVRSISSVDSSRSGALRWFERCGIPSDSGEMVILIGVPSHDRKLVAFLLDDAHRIAAVLKVGVTPGGALSVAHEAEVLRQLEPYPWAPRLLTAHPGLCAAAQEYAQGVMPDRVFRPEYLDILCHMPRSGSYRSLADVANELENSLSPYKDFLEKIAPGLVEHSLGCLDLNAVVPTILVHGDFAAWNMRKNSETGYALVDWEWGNFTGLPAYDLFHFFFNDDRLFGEKTGDYPVHRARSICTEYFRRMSLDADLMPRLAIAYLLDQLESHCRGRGSTHMAYTLHQLKTATLAIST